MKIWQRYLLRKLCYTFAFLLLCIFTVYVLVDLSINGVRFIYKGNASGIDLLLYYVRHFAMHLELFLPLTFLLSSLKVLFDGSTHFEWVALQMAGLSRKLLLIPFFLFASFLTLLSYFNSQWLAPDATFAAQEFKASQSKSKKKIQREHLQAIALEDDSELVYQKFDEVKQELFDVFWVRSSKDIWHIKTLDISQKPPIGHFVDHLIRHQQLEKAESFDTKLFPELPLTENTSPKPFIPFESRTLSTLLWESIYASSDKASVRTHLQYKLALPLLSPLLLLAIAPVCLQFSRNRPFFLIVAMSLFGFIATMILFDSLLILGENQVIPSWIAMWLPIAGLFFLSIRKFAKL